MTASVILSEVPSTRDKVEGSLRRVGILRSTQNDKDKMKIIKINNKNMAIAAEILKSGGVVVFPTETAYGLAADPFNKKAIKKVYAVKGRDFNKPLPLIAADFSAVKKYFKTSALELKLAKKYWPGPLTIILKHKTQLTKLKGIWNQKEIAVRVSPNKIAHDLAVATGGFIISTSANVSGAPECFSAKEILKQFKNRRFSPNLILDAGHLKKSEPSTIVKVEKGKVIILRQGVVKLN
jgi:L-threonylcarbamoyladenylate synthase